MERNRFRCLPGQSRRGAIMIIAALIFTSVLVMAGIVIDLGTSYVRGSNLQAAADAAAFAAATVLPIPTSSAGDAKRAEAIALVNDYVLKNGDENDLVVGVDFEDTFVDDLEGELCTAVRVRLQREVPFLFGPIVGIDSKIVAQHAKVRIEAIIGGVGIAPLGISKERRDETPVGGNVAIKFDTHDDEVVNGNFGSLDLNGGGGGANEFYNHYVDGYYGDLVFNDPSQLIEPQPGVIEGKARTGFDDRFDVCTHFPTAGGCTTAHFVPTCPRVIIIVIYNRVTENPPHRYLPLGLAPYILESYEDKSLIVAPVEMRYKTGKTTELTDLNYDFGLFRTRLVE